MFCCIYVSDHTITGNDRIVPISAYYWGMCECDPTGRTSLTGLIPIELMLIWYTSHDRRHSNTLHSSIVGFRLNPFPSYKRFLTPLQQTAFWKHSDKRSYFTKRAISPFATMFSTFSHRLSIQLLRYSIFCHNMFKVVCCRIVVWGKGLSIFRLQTQFRVTAAYDIWNRMWRNEKLLMISTCSFCHINYNFEQCFYFQFKSFSLFYAICFS